MITTGLIIGKFCPPHKGHQFLIDTALKEVDQLTILLCESKEDAIPAALRKKWLLNNNKNITLHLINTDIFDRNNPNEWIRVTKEVLDFTPTYIFSSEVYGELYAELMGCTHRMIDQYRQIVPISASEILENPIKTKNFLDPEIAEYLINKDTQ